MNPLLASQAAPPQGPPQGAPMGGPMAGPPQGDQPQGGPPQAGPPIPPDQLAKAHEFADASLQELMGLVAKPPGQLSKQDVFQGAASLLGKGLFNDPQARAGLVASLTQLPDDEGALRKILGGQILQMSGLKRRLDEHSAQNPQPAAGG